MPHPLNLPCEQLSARYLAGASTIALARRYGCSPTTIAKRLRGCGTILRRARFANTTIPEPLLRQLYIEQRWSIAAIAAYFGVSVSTIGNKRRAYNIAARPRRLPA